MLDLKKYITFIAILLLAGCVSNNIKTYHPDLAVVNQAKNNGSEKININNVTMLQGNKNSIMCRMGGNIYLPNKVTYSQYIQDAFKKVLISAGRSDDIRANGDDISIELTKLDFSTISGEWYINANIKVNNNAPIKVVSITKFGTSWDAWSACVNASEAFEGAINNFISITLSNIKQ